MIRVKMKEIENPVDCNMYQVSYLDYAAIKKQEPNWMASHFAFLFTGNL